MKTNDSKLIYRLTIKLTKTDLAKLKQQQLNSTCLSISEYTRNILFNKPINILYRDQSLDDLIEEIVILNNEMNLLKNEVAEVVAKLNQHPQIKELSVAIKDLDQTIQELCKKIEEIKKQIKKITDKWLQS